MTGLLHELKVQRWDDHRYYHHSKVNQSLHLLSATSFLFAYVVAFTDPAMAALIGWLVAMTTRQIGHLFFEPRGYDAVNQATDEYKEEIKVGYNIRRKVVLMAAWLMVPVVLWPLSADDAGAGEFLNSLGMWWLALAVAGLLLRVVQLWLKQNLLTGLTWALKIITDPFHDIALYYKAPWYVLRGEFIDPMPHVRHR